jgi:hypothetical protein
MAAVTPGLVLRILLISPRNSASSSSRMTYYIRYFNRIYRTVIAPLSHAYRLFYIPGTLLNKKFKNPIFPVRNYMSSALCAFALPTWRWRFSCVGYGVNLYSSLSFKPFYHLFFHSFSALSLIFVF